MAWKLSELTAIEILDSRGRPTLWAKATVNGFTAAASVPSGASTGKAEAVELRDGDPSRYGGLGCRRAAGHVSREIAVAVKGQSFDGQASFDRALIALDGTPDKSRLGANATLAASLAFARAAAGSSGQPLYRYFAAAAGTIPKLPQLTVNLFSGGKHASGQVPIQDVLLVPAADTVSLSLQHVAAVVREAQKLIVEKYHERPLKADEGGLAPSFASVESMFDDAVECIVRAGLAPGKDMSLAVDVASSHFYDSGRYHISEPPLTSSQMIARIADWTSRWPILSIEDGLAETDADHWPALRRCLAPRVMTLGDDFLCTNPSRIRQAIQHQAADALLLKVNQIGTLTESIEALHLARQAGWKVTVSARSGETEDDWLADLATGLAGNQIKVGSIQQSERLSKYNRLLQIEHEWHAS